MFVFKPFTFLGGKFFLQKRRRRVFDTKTLWVNSSIPNIEIGIVNSVFIVSKVQVIQPSEKTTAEC